MHKKKYFLMACVCCMLLAFSGCAKIPEPAPSKQQVSLSKSLGTTVCTTASKNIGKPYKYGGSNPQTGFDCSGLLLWAYQQHGIDLPRTAREQMRAGSPIKKSQLQPGDVVAFKISNRRGYHTGIYKGAGEFIHSPSKGQHVRIDHIDSEYWKPRLVATRRVIKK